MGAAVPVVDDIYFHFSISISFFFVSLLFKYWFDRMPIPLCVKGVG